MSGKRLSCLPADVVPEAAEQGPGYQVDPPSAAGIQAHEADPDAYV